MDSLKEHMYKKGSPKYIEIVYDDETQDKLREYCNKYGFDLSISFSGKKQNPEEYNFHTTIFYTKTLHRIVNQDYVFEPIDIVEPIGFDLFGENKDIPVLLVKSNGLSFLRSYYEKYYNMKDAFEGGYNPHISLSYNRESIPDLSKIELPSFPLTYDKIKIQDVQD